MQMGCAECAVPWLCCVAGQRVAVSLGTGSDASQPADDSCAAGATGTPKKSVPEQIEPGLWWPRVYCASIPASPAFLKKTRAWECCILQLLYILAEVLRGH